MCFGGGGVGVAGGGVYGVAGVFSAMGSSAREKVELEAVGMNGESGRELEESSRGWS